MRCHSSTVLKPVDNAISKDYDVWFFCCVDLDLADGVFLGKDVVDLRLRLKNKRLEDDPPSHSRFTQRWQYKLYFQNRYWAEEEIGRPYSPQAIDFEGIRRWMHSCHKYHSDCA